MYTEIDALFGEKTGWNLRLDKNSIQLWHKKICKAEFRTDTSTLWLDMSITHGENPLIPKEEFEAVKEKLINWFKVKDLRVRRCQPLPRTLYWDLCAPFQKPIQLGETYWYNVNNDSKNPKWVERICGEITDDEIIGTFYNRTDHHIWCTKTPEIYAH